MTSKFPLQINLENPFSSLMVTEESSIKHESQVQTTAIYPQRIEIQNAKSKAGAEKTNPTV